MPLLFDKHIGSNSCVTLWHITESVEDLMLLLNCKVDPTILEVNEQLKKQRISSRILVNKLCKKPCNEIQYDEFNKPSLINSNSKISISHSHNYVAVILNTLNETGIDIELIKPQVERIATRFMSETELANLDRNKTMEQLTTFWCAKETLYKFYGKKELLFKENIFIKPFIQTENGVVEGHIRTKHININLQMCYEKMGDYILVYVND